MTLKFMSPDLPPEYIYIAYRTGPIPYWHFESGGPRQYEIYVIRIVAKVDFLILKVDSEPIKTLEKKRLPFYLTTSSISKTS